MIFATHEHHGRSSELIVTFQYVCCTDPRACVMTGVQMTVLLLLGTQSWRVTES